MTDPREETESPYPIEVTWEGGMRYRGGPAGGPELRVDGKRAEAPSPVDALLVALASCSAIDVVEILEKRRTPPASLSVSVRFARRSEPPRRVTRAHLAFRVAADSDRGHVERAIILSLEKYCSVAASLTPEAEVTWEVEMQPAEETAAP